MTQTFSRNRFTWLAYLLIAFYAYFLNVLGPIIPFLKEELQLSYTVSSLHFSAFALGVLLVGLGGHLLIRHLGRWRSLWLGSIGLSLGALLLLTGRIPAITIGAAFLMGLIGSLILAIVPAALADQHGELRAVAVSEANVISAFTATAAPLMVGGFARFTGDWRMALGLVALAPLLLFLSLGKGSSPPADSSLEGPDQAGQPLSALFWIYWVALTLSISIEFCLVFWSADYLERVLGLSKANAAQGVSLFLAAMILGRITGSRLVQHFSTRLVVTGSILIASLGFLIFWQTENVLIGLSGLFIMGLGVANLYPLILVLALGTTPNTVQASTRASLATGTAILFLPLVLGSLADEVGIRLAYGVVVLLLLSVFLISQIAGRINMIKARATLLLL